MINLTFWSECTYLFVLDLNTDESDTIEKGKIKKWTVTPFGKKSKFRGVMDGAPLTHEGICQVYQLIEFLRKESNISVEGIFRRTGSLNRQQELRNLLNQGSPLNLESGQYSVHDCASVLKGFLADLPEPLLTEAAYPAYCQIANLCGTCKQFNKESRLLESLQLLLLLLPQENRVLLKDVLDLLNLTASYENQNKMSADSLATLYTPHLLCPRKLTPEVLHTSSQTLTGILSYMIKNSAEVFSVPMKLGLDIKAYFNDREKRKVSPSRNFNDSISDNCAAHTVFSFVDHERTAKENEANPTERELAQLYAYIQGLPESSKKRKLVKQFNKENGYGTPLQLVRSRLTKNKTFGDSIKKHIFQKGLVKSVRKASFTQLRSSSDNLLSTPKHHPCTPVRRAFFCTSCDSHSDVSTEGNSAKKLKKSNTLSDIQLLNQTKENIKFNHYSDEVNIDEKIGTPPLGGNCLTSTPAYVPFKTCHDILFTPENQERKSMSPITRSTQNMCRAMQETMMTPRSRKPVLVVSGTNIHNIPKLNDQNNLMTSVAEEKSNDNQFDTTNESPELIQNIETEYEPKLEQSKDAMSTASQSLTSTFREYLCNRSMLTASPADLSFSSRTDDYCSCNLQDISPSKLSSSLLHCLDGNEPDGSSDSSMEEKELVLKPKQFDENGLPIVFETSF
ncbi:rho gtpase activating protein [Holotrichia oblita]|uniref:Rho gtpase activating protein n=1 Tax=Holotrichia oblita TaxID=644536 RepID=A0ACB9SUG8_HOLOL|nr:rho gtpase activating protein [Holotrichia oblita]